MKKLNRVVYFNGIMIPESEAKVSIYDSSLMFGDMIFEMTRSFNGIQFKLEEHIDRLFTGIKILEIPFSMSKKDLLNACYQTIDANKDAFEKDDEHRLMIDISRGLLGIYHGIDGLNKGTNLIIADFPLRWTVASMGELFDIGINAVITSQRAISSQMLDPKIKNRSRIHYLMANIEASKFQGNNNWALLLDEDGFIAEGCGDNFFIVKDNFVISPEGRNMLRGISRSYVLNELCKELKIPTIEKNIEPYDVHTADEAFMTGTPFCILPVTSLNSLPIKDGKIGKIYQKLLNQWSLNVNIDIRGQIKKWDKFTKKELNDAPTPYKFRK